MSEPVLTYFGVKLSILQGATAGSAVAFLMNDGTLRQKLLAAGVGALFAVFGTEGVLGLVDRFITITDATQRLGGLVFGITGILCVQTLLKGVGRFRDRSSDLVDGVVEKRVVTMTKETTKVSPNPPVADAPAIGIPGAPNPEAAG